MLENIRAHLDEPTSRGLADAVSAAIRAGELSDGELLPPVRAMARGLAVSPTTVSAAWSLLRRAGAISTDGRRGTRVTSPHPGPARYRRAIDGRTRFTVDLSTGVPDPALLPALGPALARLHGGEGPGSYLDDPVLPELVPLLKDMWPWPAERISVVDGAMDAMQQIVATHVRFGDHVVVEDPTFPPLLDLLDMAGAIAHGVPVDECGVVPESLAKAISPRTRAVILQPRGQNPTGATLTPARREKIAQLLAKSGAIVVEDDATGDVATSAPISLGSSLPNRVLHIRSFSKSHSPDLRLAAIGGPTRLVDPVIDRRRLGQGWSSRLLQALLLDLLTDPQAKRQVTAARKEYGRRRRLLTQQLNAQGLDVRAPDGINLWLPVRDEAAALVRLASRGIGVAAGEPFTVHRGGRPHVRITAGLVGKDHQPLAKELADAAKTGGWTGPR